MAVDANVESLVAHPGLAKTDMVAAVASAADGPWFFRLEARYTGMSAAGGARPLLRAATDPHAKGGQLYAPRFVNNGPPVRRPLLGRSVNRRSMSQPRSSTRGTIDHLLTWRSTTLLVILQKWSNEIRPLLQDHEEQGGGEEGTA